MGITLGELADRFDCELRGSRDTEVDQVAPLSAARPTAIAFLSNAAFKAQLADTQAAAVILRADDAADCPVSCIVTDNPYAIYAKIAALIHPAPAPAPGVHPSAVVSESATVAESCSIAANAVIEDGANLGDACIVGAGAVVGPGCTIGASTRLHANVTLVRAVTIGERCIVHAGAVIGGDGFGNAMTPDGWVKVPQLGGVVIGDDVEIGCNTTVDCGALGDTVIGNGVRIDNLCMIGHNARIGEHTAMAAQVGIAGSTVIGARVLFAGHSGTVGHMSVCDDAFITGKTMVTKDVTTPGTYSGAFAAEPARDWAKNVARIRRLDELSKRVRRLEKDKT